MEDRITLANARTVSQGIGAFTQVWRSSKSMSEVPGNLYNSMTGGTTESSKAGGKATQKNDGKPVQETMRARYLNNPNMLPGGPQSNASFTQDTFAFSPEALALMG